MKGLKTLIVLKIFTFLSPRFGYLEKELHKKATGQQITIIDVYYPISCCCCCSILLVLAGKLFYFVKVMYVSNFTITKD